MHYIFDRRLNMLDIALNDLSDENLYDEKTEDDLVKENRIDIPDLKFKELSQEIKSVRITYDNAPKDFKYTLNEDYDYILFKIPFTKEEFVTDLFKTGEKDQGCYITPQAMFYKEYSAEKIKENPALIEELKKKAISASNEVQEKIDQYQHQAKEFNETTLPAEVRKRLDREKIRRRNREALQHPK